MVLKVGDIVIVHGWDVCEGMKGFIDSIVTDPKLQRNGILYTGSYSVYGLEEGKFEKDDKFYFGDFAGKDLEETGTSMTVKDLEKYKQQHSETNKLLEEEIPIIIKNLGRELGKNDGAKDMFEELEKHG